MLKLLFTLLLASFWAPQNLSLGDINLNVILVAPLAVIGLMSLPRMQASARDRAVVWVIVLATCCLITNGLISIFWAVDPLRTFRPIYSFGVGLVLLISILSAPPEIELERTAWRMILLGVWVSGAIAVVAYTVPSVWHLFASAGSEDRTAALFKQANQFGMVLACVGPYVAVQTFIRRNWPLAVATSGIIFFSLALSGSKTNIVLWGIGVFAAVVIVMFRRGLAQRNPLAFFVVTGLSAPTILGAGLALVALNPRAVTLMGRFASEGQIQSSQGRSLLWETSIQIGQTHPWTGTGAGQRLGLYSHSHNVFLEYFRTLGVPGLTAIIVLLAACALLALHAVFGARRRPIDKWIDSDTAAVGLGVGVLIYLLSNQLSDSFGPSTTPYFWVVLGLLLKNRSAATPLNFERGRAPPTRRPAFGRRSL